MIPREHGAYAQIAFPLLSVWLGRAPTVAAVLLTVAAVGAFVAHEAILVLLGARGTRARRQNGRAAGAWFLGVGVPAVACGVTAVVIMAPGIRWTVAGPLGFAALLAPFLARRREHTTAGETLAAAALAACALPVAASLGADIRDAVITTATWVVAFACVTVSVRSLLGRTRRIGWLLALAACGLATGAAAAAVGPWRSPAALAPFALVTIWIDAARPAPRHLKRVGFVLVGACTIAAAALALGR